MRILVIPEDFRKDQYMLKPIIKAIVKELGKEKAKVRICQNPLLGGINEALKWDNIKRIIGQYPTIDLFLLCVDRDGQPGRRKALDKIESFAAECLSAEQLLLAENAWQEIEVWVLAGHKLPKDWNWQEIRKERDPKETYFLPFAREKLGGYEPDDGRKILAEEAAKHYRRIRELCPEDVANLEERIREWLEKRRSLV